MTDAPLPPPHDAVDGARMMADLTELARWVKLSGTPEERESLEFLRSRLDDAGYRTRIIEHDAFISLPGEATVTVDGRALRAITHSMARPTPADGLQARLVDVGDGKPANLEGRDLRGMILLVQGMSTPDMAARASAAGAAATLHVSNHQHLHEMCISPVWGSPSPETLANLPTIASCTISGSDGAALREQLRRGETPDVVLHAAVDTGWRKTPILVAELDGPEGAETPFVLFSGHHDTWHHGVMDNGSANAAMLEVARLCAEARASWQRGLRICFWSGHSHGRYSGSTWYADNHWAELDRLCVAHVNIDSPGGIGATVLEDAAAAAELSPLAAAAVLAGSGQGYAGKRKTRNSDESFPGIGIPSMFGSISAQPPGPVAMRNPLGWWWHTPDDLLDKIDPANQVRDTRVLLHAVWELLTTPILPLDYAAHARQLRAEVAPLAEAIGTRLSLREVLSSLVKLEEQSALITGSTASAGAAEDVNRALMQASRALVPLDYGTGDRFAHDPALPLRPWPVLDPIRHLATTGDGSDAAKLATVSATRARNRLLHALSAAVSALEQVT